MPQKYGYMANLTEAARKVIACLVCDEENPNYSWTDYSGEGYCIRCGTPYQLKWGELKEGESYPRINVRADALEMLRSYWNETKSLNPFGTFLCMDDYPEKVRASSDFRRWWTDNKHRFPHLDRKQEDATE